MSLSAALASPTTIPADSHHKRSFVHRLIRGREDAAAYERPALLVLLALTAVLYLWDLGASGWANSFYSAAVQAGSVNWQAFLFGSSDAANSITVDKPPASLWIMALSVRVFGLSSWSILVPQALMGVTTVWLVYSTVRRHFSARTALLAGTVLAFTPVAALMFRYNNPDALLVLLVTLATSLTLRGIESGRIRYVIWAGVAVGFGFLTKQLQAFLVLPVLAGAYLAFAPIVWRKRFGHLLAALAAVIVSAGWWVAIVELVPANMRPYVGGSQNNSFLELTFGYNGFGRLSGNETGSVTPGHTGTTGGTGGMWGSTGLFRLFENEIGGQITWLLPAALLLFVVGLIILRSRERTDPARALLVLFGGSMVVTASAFSFMAGIFHAYYTVALAPTLAIVVAIGASQAWAHSDRLWIRIVLSVSVLGTGVWAWALLTRVADWLPWLKYLVMLFAVVAAVLLLVPKRSRALTVTTIAVSVVAGLLAPTAYTLHTVTTAHTGSIITAGPTVNSTMGGPGGGGHGGGFGGGPNGGSSQNSAGGNLGGMPGGGQAGGAPPGGAMPGGGSQPNGRPSEGVGVTGPGRAGGGMSSLTQSRAVSSTVAALLKKNAASFTWVAATVGSDSAASYQLATRQPVMSIGGFNGSDPSPTLAQFKKYVAEKKIHYFIAGSVGASNGGSTASSQITEWVKAHFTAKTVDGVTLYDLTT